MTMTSAAKRALATTIRGLRQRLLDDLHSATDGAYHLGITRLADAGLSAARAAKRVRLEAWIGEQVRALPKAQQKAPGAARRFRRQVEHDAAATLLNRLIFVRLLEGFGLRREAVVSGGWDSPAYKAFRELAPALVSGEGDDTEGYAFLLRLVFEDLAVDLPGLFGDVGLTGLIPIPAGTLRAVVDALGDPALDSCWTDDMTLGWVYQYWNDPAREALDAKLNGGGKVEPHEIAAKTQMFTERYMVEWLLQNSLGQIWRAMWTPDAFVPGPDGTSTIDRLEARRAAWRARREAGEVALDALMPIDSRQEERWKYWVQQPLPADLSQALPEHPMDLKILDPACGSGHFLVVAFDLLWAIYAEHASRGGPAFDEEQVCGWILEQNLHGIDLDPRAVQIAAAALVLKAWTRAPAYRPASLNLVATRFGLAELPHDDPARAELRRALHDEAGLPDAFTDHLVDELAGVDHLGSLLKVDAAIDAALRRFDEQHGDLFGERRAGAHVARNAVQEKLEAFLARHTTGADLGLRLRGQELAAGVRFVRIVKEDRYHLVVANPPYQGTAKMADAAYVKKTYPKGKADLFAAFLERGLQLTRPGGLSAMVTMRNWMFIKQYEALRKWLIEDNDLRALGDLGPGAFEEIGGAVVSTATAVFRRGVSKTTSIAHRVDGSQGAHRTAADKRAGLMCGVGRYEFETRRFRVIEGEPLVYWWTPDFLDRYARTPKLGDIASIRQGASTADNTRFLRNVWEILRLATHRNGWVPFIKGASGRQWVDTVSDVVRWHHDGIEVRSFDRAVVRNPDVYFRRGIAYTAIGAGFSGRLHRRAGVIADTGPSIYTDDAVPILALLNSRFAADVAQSLNPGIHFQKEDVARLPLVPIESADEIYARLDEAFTEHEAHREPSVEFRQPGPSCWTYAQDWAQRSVDRAEGAPLPPWEPTHDTEPATDHVSYALGVALGRFDAGGAGVLDPADVPPTALPHGICFLSAADDDDSLTHPASLPAVVKHLPAEKCGPCRGLSLVSV